MYKTRTCINHVYQIQITYNFLILGFKLTCINDTVVWYTWHVLFIKTAVFLAQEDKSYLHCYFSLLIETCMLEEVSCYRLSKTTRNAVKFCSIIHLTLLCTRIC